MTADGAMNRRRFLQSLAAVGVVVACGPTGTPSPTPAASGSQAAKAVSIEWWRRNYAAGTQSAETITSDAAGKGHKKPPSSPGNGTQSRPIRDRTGPKL